MYMPTIPLYENDHPTTLKEQVAVDTGADHNPHVDIEFPEEGTTLIVNVEPPLGHIAILRVYLNHQ